MKIMYFYLTRKQIVVVWQDSDGRHTRAYSKNDKGERASIAKMNALHAAGYTRTEAPRDWFTELVASVRSQPHDGTQGE